METIEKILNFIGSYPLYVKIAVSSWAAFGIVLIVLFILSPRKEQSENMLFINDINALWHPLINRLVPNASYALNTIVQ